MSNDPAEGGFRDPMTKPAEEFSPTDWGRAIDALPVNVKPYPSPLMLGAALMRASFLLRKDGNGNYDAEQADALDQLLARMKANGQAMTS